jgi:hypothetical protein
MVPVSKGAMELDHHNGQALVVLAAVEQHLICALASAVVQMPIHGTP